MFKDLMIGLVSGCLLVHMVSAVAWAADDKDSGREQEVSERAKKRQYPGGSDESDLKVQNPMPIPTRKIAPSVGEEKSETPDTHED